MYCLLEMLLYYLQERLGLHETVASFDHIRKLVEDRRGWVQRWPLGSIPYNNYYLKYF